MGEQDSGWSLEHRDDIERDDIENGPFELVDLIATAQAGHLAPDTRVRHSRHTRDQWTVATRVTTIAQVLSAAASTFRCSLKLRKTPYTAGSSRCVRSHGRAACSQYPRSSTTARPGFSSLAFNPRNQKFFYASLRIPLQHEERQPKVLPVRQRILARFQHKACQHKAYQHKPQRGRPTSRSYPSRTGIKQPLIPRTLPDAFFDFRFRFHDPLDHRDFLGNWCHGCTAVGTSPGLRQPDSTDLSTEANMDQDSRSWQFELLEGKPLLRFPAVRYLTLVPVISCYLLMLRLAREA